MTVVGGDRDQNGDILMEMGEEAGLALNDEHHDFVVEMGGFDMREGPARGDTMCAAGKVG